MWGFYPGLFEGQLCPHGGRRAMSQSCHCPGLLGRGALREVGRRQCKARGLGRRGLMQGGGRSGPQDEPRRQPGEATRKYGPSSTWPFGSQGNSRKTDLTLRSRNEPCPAGAMSCHIPVALRPTPLRPERFPWPPSELCRLHRISSVAVTPEHDWPAGGQGGRSPCREKPSSHPCL